MKRAFSTRLAAILASAGLVAGLAACSNNDNGNTNASSDAKIKVVASTKVWADVADLVTDDKSVSIEPIISSNDIDPHSYQPTAADMAKVEGADILVAGGGHYDAWLTASLEKKDGKTVISALEMEKGHDHAGHADHDKHDEHGAEGHDEHEGHEEHGAEGHDEHEGHDHGAEVNEHIWYDTEKVDQVAEELSKALTDKGAKASAEKVEKRLDDINAIKGKIKAAKIAQVHPLADDILKNTKVEDITPEAYRKATLSESEPAAADINKMLELINSGKLDYLIDAPQTHDQVSERLVEAAKAKGIKIVNVYESPSKDQTFFDLYEKTLKDMENV